MICVYVRVLVYCIWDAWSDKAVCRASKAHVYPSQACTCIFPPVYRQIKATQHRLCQRHVTSVILRQDYGRRASGIRRQRSFRTSVSDKVYGPEGRTTKVLLLRRISSSNEGNQIGRHLKTKRRTDRPTSEHP